MLIREIIDVYFKTTRKTLLHSVYKMQSIIMVQGMVHVITIGLEMVKARFSFKVWPACNKPKCSNDCHLLGFYITQLVMYLVCSDALEDSALIWNKFCHPENGGSMPLRNSEETKTTTLCKNANKHHFSINQHKYQKPL